MIDLQNQDGIFVLRMQSGENRFNLPFIDALDAALDQVEQVQARALVTVGEGKFYSNGLDLEWMGGPGREQAAATVGRVHKLLGRMLAFPTITVAALNGHTFAAGAMLALAHDFRVMRDDRGFFCLPEADIQIPFTEAMDAVIRCKLSKATAHEAMVTGRRYTAEQARSAQIVHDSAAEAEVLPAALTLAKTYAGKHAPTLTAIKRTMYQTALAACDAASK
ncbi:MAG TPA: enoyl-CoA hydratase-related protein [Polyangiales bacterium]|nr:enoyl-CoA hydratase-related protein [Polyangiales bacterium]